MVIVEFAKDIPNYTFTGRDKDIKYLAISEFSNIVLGMYQGPELSLVIQIPVLEAFLFKIAVGSYSVIGYQFLIMQNIIVFHRLP